MNRHKEELDSWLWKIIKVYAIANEAFCYTEYFHNPKTKEEREFAFNSAHKSDMSTIVLTPYSLDRFFEGV